MGEKNSYSTNMWMKGDFWIFDINKAPNLNRTLKRVTVLLA